MLELDHVFYLVPDLTLAARRLEDDGWMLDAGQAHRGQGTRNRRLLWREQFFELLWVTDPAEAHANPLRLDRRADWISTGASPIGLAFRGQLEPADTEAFWLYDALGPRIWVHHDNERAPGRPLILVLEASEQQVKQRRRRFATSQPLVNRLRGELSQIRVCGPAAPELPRSTGPQVVYEPGPHALELVASQEGHARSVVDGLTIRY